MTNDMFANYAWYFRNALVRANYQNLKLGVYRTTEYLERFLQNLLLDESHLLSNRCMHIYSTNGNIQEESIQYNDNGYTISRDAISDYDATSESETVEDMRCHMENSTTVPEGRVSSLDEFALINKLTQHSIYNPTYVKVGVGDDCAVYDTPCDVDQLVSTDMMVEGIHFSESTTAPFDVGYRLGAANISDIAAMGGTPRHMVVSIAYHRRRYGVDRGTFCDFCHSVWRCFNKSICPTQWSSRW